MAKPGKILKCFFLVAFSAKDVRQNLFWLILWSQKYCQILVPQAPAAHKWKFMAKIGAYNGRSIQLIAFGIVYIMVFPLSTLNWPKLSEINQNTPILGGIYLILGKVLPHSAQQVWATAGNCHFGRTKWRNGSVLPTTLALTRARKLFIKFKRVAVCLTSDPRRKRLARASGHNPYPATIWCLNGVHTQLDSCVDSGL